MSLTLRGQAGLPDAFYRIKNFDPSQIYRISNSQNTYNYLAAAHFTRDYLKILNFDTQKLSPDYSFWARDLKLRNYLVYIIPNNNFFSNFWTRSSISRYADNYVDMIIPGWLFRTTFTYAQITAKFQVSRSTRIAPICLFLRALYFPPRGLKYLWVRAPVSNEMPLKTRTVHTWLFLKCSISRAHTHSTHLTFRFISFCCAARYFMEILSRSKLSYSH